MQIKRVRSMSLHLCEALGAGNLTSSGRKQFCGCRGVVGHARTFGVVKIILSGLQFRVTSVYTFLKTYELYVQYGCIFGIYYTSNLI